MSEKKLVCPICNESFSGCRSCEKNNLSSWKTLTDTENHFNIYVILHRYNVTKKYTKEQAKELLLKCDLVGLENFKPNVAESIANILKEEPKVVEPVIIKEEIEFEEKPEPTIETTVEPIVEVKKEIKTEIEPEIKQIKKQYNKKNTKR